MGLPVSISVLLTLCVHVCAHTCVYVWVGGSPVNHVPINVTTKWVGSHLSTGPQLGNASKIRKIATLATPIRHEPEMFCLPG